MTVSLLVRGLALLALIAYAAQPPDQEYFNTTTATYLVKRSGSKVEAEVIKAGKNTTERTGQVKFRAELKGEYSRFVDAYEGTYHLDIPVSVATKCPALADGVDVKAAIRLGGGGRNPGMPITGFISLEVVVYDTVDRESCKVVRSAPRKLGPFFHIES